MNHVKLISFGDKNTKPVHALLCSYSNGRNKNIIFNMLELFGHNSSRITMTNLKDWDNAFPTSSNYRMGYFCVLGETRQCEFTFDDDVKSDDVKDYQSPFGHNPGYC